MNNKSTKSNAYIKEYNENCLFYMKKYKEKEEWRHLIYNNILTKYIVSNYGRIIDTEKNKVPTMKKWRGHYYVSIKLGKNKFKNLGIYRLVATAFIPIPQKYFDLGYTDSDLVVDHKRDGDEDNFEDNTIWNLQWMTHRENISKAANCGFKSAYPKEFRNQLDSMILNDCSNKVIYEFFNKLYGYTKEDLKPQVQVRRRRLGKTLKEHYERDKKIIKETDKLLMKGLSNNEIIELLDMPKEGRSSARFLQYRRSVLKIPANVSKYFTNEQNNELNKLLIQDISNIDILKHFNLDKLPELDQKKILLTIRTRRNRLLRKMKQSNVSSTTIETVS